MKIKTSELTGVALDWAVVKSGSGKGDVWNFIAGHADYGMYHYSTDWARGGTVIERGRIDLYYSTEKRLWSAAMWQDVPGGGQLMFKQTDCPTPLIAAMRCYVASKLGDEVDVPKELLP